MTAEGWSGRLVLPSGSWVDRCPISNGTRRRALQASGVGGSSDSLLVDWAFFDVILTDTITAWSFELPLPSVDATAMDALPMDEANELYAELRKLLIPMMGTNFAPSPDPASPTGPSSDS